MGIVARRPNRGAIVRDFTVREIEEIYFVRELLERSAVEVMPLPAAPDVVRTLEERNKHHREAIVGGRLREVFRLNLEFHKVFYEACGNDSLSNAVAQFALKAHGTRSYSIADPSLLARVSKEHSQILKLLRTSDRGGARQTRFRPQTSRQDRVHRASRRIEAGMES